MTVLVTDLPETGVGQRLPRGTTARIAPDGEVFLWDGARHASIGRAPIKRSALRAALWNLKGARLYEKGGFAAVYPEAAAILKGHP
jgi:hypothetical protein